MQKILFIGILVILGCNGKQLPPQEPARGAPFSIDELQRRTFLYFWELADSNNFQVPDRYPTLTFSSVAATGFGLSSYLVGIERGYVSREAAAERVVRTLRVLHQLPEGEGASGIASYKGFFYHFLTLDKAVRFKKVELSSIDTGLLMAGVLSVMSYFDGPEPVEQEIRALADALYRRVEWDWMLDDNLQLSMGWHPESGFIPARWKGYNEAMILLLMAIGSPTHAIPPESWGQWCSTYQWAHFQGQDFVQFDPLFGHQYSHIWIDFRGIQDEYMRQKGIDYFENSRRATLANRNYCLENPLGFNGYSGESWGLTACDGPANEKREVNGHARQFFDYRARGASALQAVDDGTIAPTAAGGSIAFEPELCLSALEYLWQTHYSRLVGDYGFRDAFNLSYTFGKGNENGWFDVDYLGIDQGPILLQAENHRSGLLWTVMKKNPYLTEGLKRAGFNGGWLEGK
ncbi:MAG: Tat pathway signal protein [Phaeodactylibacter sp.]|nr:Tat pathway signal protein [Phaeodactylibacter sp.]MCB9050408.1 Tat pathway signal protein [Lewinellaceae bacterium]